MEHENRLITVDELADYLGVPVTTLYRWRYRKEGTESESEIVSKGSSRRIKAWKL